MVGIDEFDEFVRARQDRLVGVAYLLTHDRGHAQDLVQEAMLKLYRRSRADSGVLNGAYARRVVVNEFLSHRRRRWTQELPALETELEQPGAMGVGDDDRLLVWRALGSLRPRQRAVLVLRIYEGLSDDEIAEQLGCSPGTVRSLVSRAYAALRDNPALLDRIPTTSKE